MYVPAGVPAGTDTSPVVGSMNGTRAPALSGVAGVVIVPTIVLTKAGVVRDVPFNVSLL